MAKPTVLPRWANSGGSVATPAAGKQDIGWLPGEIPAAQYENWKGLNTYTWLAWLDGLFTATDTLALPVNQHAIVSGTGRFKHGDIPLIVPAAAFVPSGQNNLAANPGATGGELSFSTPPNNVCIAALALPVGKRIKSITWRINKASNASGMVLSLKKRASDVDGTVSTTTDSTTGAGYITNTTLSAINYTLAANEPLWLEVQGGATVHKFAYAVVTYDEP